MRRNILWWDRGLRFIFGVVLLAWTIAGGPVWGYSALYLMATGSWGYCPLYSLLNRPPFEDE